MTTRVTAAARNAKPTGTQPASISDVDVARRAYEIYLARGRDLLLADGKLESKERRFLRERGSDLKLKPGTAQQILDVVVIKNQL